MDRSFRDEQLRRVKPQSLEGTALADGLAREYSLYEIAIVTRAGPARLLGLANKGHLGVGADADVAVYTPGDDIEAMFAAPRYVFKGGIAVVEDGGIPEEVYGQTLHVGPEYDAAVEKRLRKLFIEEGTLALEDYVVAEAELRSSRRVAPA
jgi:formylmethanofuran dehydrogenase subunit A